MALTWRLSFSQALSLAATALLGSPEASTMVSSRRNSNSARISKGCICGTHKRSIRGCGLLCLLSDRPPNYHRRSFQPSDVLITHHKTSLCLTLFMGSEDIDRLAPVFLADIIDRMGSKPPGGKSTPCVE